MSDPPPPSNITLPSTPKTRHAFLDALLSACTPSDLQYLSTALSPLLPAALPSTKSKSDDLPPELWPLVFGYVEHRAALLRLGTVCRAWGALVREERVWRGLYLRWGFVLGTGGDGEMGRFRMGFTKIQNWKHGGRVLSIHGLPLLSAEHPQQPQALQHTRSTSASSSASKSSPPRSSPRRRVPTPTSIPQSTSTSHTDTPSPDTGVVTSLALDADWVVAGLASARIHVFGARTGVLARTLVGHEAGVWGLCLVSAGGVEDARGGVEDGGGNGDKVREEEDGEGEGERYRQYRPERQSSPTHASNLPPHPPWAHLHHPMHARPTQLTACANGRARRDAAHVGHPRGHAGVRVGGAHGERELWDLDTGECLHVLRGHYQQVYAVAFDVGHGLGLSINLDLIIDTLIPVLLPIANSRPIPIAIPIPPTTPNTNTNTHTNLPTHPAPTLTAPPLAPPAPPAPLQQITLPEPSTLHTPLPPPGPHAPVASLQFDVRFLVSGGNDGCVRVWEARTGRPVRGGGGGSSVGVGSAGSGVSGEGNREDRANGRGQGQGQGQGHCGDGVWKVGFVSSGEADADADADTDVCVVAGRREGRTVLEIWGFGECAVQGGDGGGKDKGKGKGR
ncbi:hypothetical protein H0H92_013525 [Tricholoma furcatifolium]|nr:hypothetical protein H0H92_013525 [Tricholoma furcatifolium]